MGLNYTTTLRVSNRTPAHLTESKTRIEPGSRVNVSGKRDTSRPKNDAANGKRVLRGLDGAWYADLHSLRHTFTSLLDRSGAMLYEVMQLARHSDPKLTMAVYRRAHPSDLGAAVARLPSVFTGSSDALRMHFVARSIQRWPSWRDPGRRCLSTSGRRSWPWY